MIPRGQSNLNSTSPGEDVANPVFPSPRGWQWGGIACPWLVVDQDIHEISHSTKFNRGKSVDATGPSATKQSQESGLGNIRGLIQISFANRSTFLPCGPRLNVPASLRLGHSTVTGGFVAEYHEFGEILFPPHMHTWMRLNSVLILRYKRSKPSARRYPCVHGPPVVRSPASTHHIYFL